MKTVSIDQVQTNFASILEHVALGQTVEVMRKKKLVARIVPPDRKSTDVDWSDTWDKADAIFGKKPLRGKPGSQVVIEGRR